MFNIINSSVKNNFTIFQELSRTLDNIQGQQHVFSKIKDIFDIDSKFKDSPWRSRTSGNLISRGRTEFRVFTYKGNLDTENWYLPAARNTVW